MITKRQLKQIIREINDAPDGTSPDDVAEELLALGKEISDEMIDTAVAKAGVRDDEIPNFADAVAVKIENMNEDIVKITKRQLRRIIKEEKAKLNEVEYHGTPVNDAVKNLVNVLMSMDVMDRNIEIYDIVDQLENLASRGG
jgi:DNA replication protein DnaD